MEALGRLFDIGAGWVSTDMNTNNGETGKRIYVGDCGGVTIVVFKGAGTAGEDPTVTLKQHTAYTAGTSANLAIVDHYYLKSEALLDNDESWSKVTQTAAATIADPGGAGTSAESQQILVIEVDSQSLDDGYAWVSLDYAVTAAAAQIAGWLYIKRDLHVQRKPANLPNLLHPGAANA